MKMPMRLIFSGIRGEDRGARTHGRQAATDSDHDCPIFPDLARDRIIDGPNQ